MSPTSELAALVEAETRLDRGLAETRAEAAALVDAARREVAAPDTSFDIDVARECERIAVELAEQTAARSRAFSEDARVRAARFDAVRGDAVTAISRALVERLVAVARKDAA